jgi:hypothetical protein
LHMEASQHSLLAACFTLHSINATLAIVPQRGAGLWIFPAVVLAFLCLWFIICIHTGMIYALGIKRSTFLGNRTLMMSQTRLMAFRLPLQHEYFCHSSIFMPNFIYLHIVACTAVARQ